MLETTLKSEFIPGTNLSGGLASADWRYLLPALKARRILWLGIPPLKVLPALAFVSDEIVVLSKDYRKLQELRSAARRLDVEGLPTIVVADFSNLPLSSDSIDLVLLVSGRGISNPLRFPGAIPELGRVLSPDGVIYAETNGIRDSIRTVQGVRKLSNHHMGSPRIYFLAPWSGEVRLAVPAQDTDILHHFFSRVLYGHSFGKQVLRRIGASLSRLGLLPYVAPRRGILVEGSKTNRDSESLPLYLASLAQKSGIELAGYHWAFSGRGKYDANKVTFYLFKNSGKAPEAVIKMTRNPRFNCRLENERRMLSLLEAKGFLDPATFPKLLFFGYHRNLAVLAQKAVNGFPFRMRTTAKVDCPIALDAIECIIRLGESSADRNVATPLEVSASLQKLLTQFCQIYVLSNLEHSFLDRQIAKLGHHQCSFPVVFQHGDPGTWNVMVSDTGRAVFLDWEAGEIQGMPLWDLFYFMRSFGSWISRKGGNHDGLENFARHFLKISPLSTLLAETTDRYSRCVGLDKELVEPLFYTCWMHRALKEATRLTSDSLEQGHYVRLLRMCIRYHNAPGLTRLFHPGATVRTD